LSGAWREANLPGSSLVRLRRQTLVEIEQAFRRRVGFIFFGLLQQLFKSLLSNFVTLPMRGETLFERLIAPGRLALQLLNRHFEVFDQRLLLGLPMMDDGLCLCVDP
jgi:hypothetical protein